MRCAPSRTTTRPCARWRRARSDGPGAKMRRRTSSRSSTTSGAWRPKAPAVSRSCRRRAARHSFVTRTMPVSPATLPSRCCGRRALPSLDTVRGWVAFALTWFNLAVLTYFLVLNTLYLVFSAISFLRLREHRRRWTRRELDAVIRSPATPGISLIVPAYNEEATIVESVRALLLLNYPSFEIVVVNDGAKDRTMAVIIAAYGMLPAPPSYPQQDPTAPGAGFHPSLAHPGVGVNDKANGGKAGAIKAGINAAQDGLGGGIGGDSNPEEHALTPVVLPFNEGPDTVAS